MFRVFIFFLIQVVLFVDVAKPLPTFPIHLKRGEKKT